MTLFVFASLCHFRLGGGPVNRSFNEVVSTSALGETNLPCVVVFTSLLIEPLEKMKIWITCYNVTLM